MNLLLYEWLNILYIGRCTFSADPDYQEYKNYLKEDFFPDYEENGGTDFIRGWWSILDDIDDEMDPDRRKLMKVCLESERRNSKLNFSISVYKAVRYSDFSRTQESKKMRTPIPINIKDVDYRINVCYFNLFNTIRFNKLYS